MTETELDRPAAVALKHQTDKPTVVFAAPSGASPEFNTLGERLVPKGCFKVEDLLFAFDSSFISPEIKVHLPKLTALRNQHKEINPSTGKDVLPPLSIFGHADPVGNDDYNKKLSGRRATSMYALLVRDVDLWEKLFSHDEGGDKWGLHAIQAMISEVQSPVATDGKNTDETKAAIKAFQEANGLKADGDAGPKTRKVLFRAYMDALCGPDLLLDKATDFLGRHADEEGKADFQGCGEFNPILIFSKDEKKAFDGDPDHTERNQENAPNRRVTILLFAPGRRVNASAWPCPRATEGTAACKKRFFPDADERRSNQDERRKFEDTKNTFACRFYQAITDDSPCERVVPPLPVDEVNAFIAQLDAPAPVAAGASSSSSGLTEVKGLFQTAGSSSALAAKQAVGDGLLGPQFGFVMVRHDPNTPRQAFTLSVDKTFDGQGTLTISPAGQINFFKVGGDGKTPMNFTTDNVFQGADLSKPGGVVIFGEGVTPSKKKNDITLTLTLSGGTKTIKSPGSIKLTSVELTLDICDPPDKGKQPVPLKSPDKRTKGATISAAGDPPQARRAVLIVQQALPSDLKHELLLHTLSGRIDIFEKETPAKDEKPTSGVINIKSETIKKGGTRFFVGGKFASKKAAEETIHLGISTGALGTLLADTVAVTVVAGCDVNLKLSYKDPVTGKDDHPFPKDLPVTFTFDDGSTQEVKLGDDGKLRVFLEKSHKHAKLSLKFAKPTFIASATAATPTADPKAQFALADALQPLLDKGYRVFQMPLETTLRTATWSNVPANADTAGLDISVANIGTDTAPINLVLDPRWQHFQFLYHDRKLLKTMTVPPLMIESFDAAPTGTAIARSNWQTETKGCQAVPWILTRKPDDSARNKPDGAISLRFRTAPKTFVDSSTPPALKLVTGGTPPADALVTRGANSGVNFDTPGAARLAFYDLPEEWRSPGHFAAPTPASGTPVPVDFKTISGNATADDKPIMFKLDDIVLCNESGGKLAVSPWDPAKDRVAIFHHTFATGTNLSPIGLYKADTTNQRSFLSQQVPDLTAKNLIADYPDWTRLVAFRGNLYEVFDRRVPNTAKEAIGARAGVRFVDSAAIAKPGATLPKRKPTLKPFFAIHPFYSQEQFAQFGGNPVGLDPVGRFDLVVLRCCGVETNGVTETALAMCYIRFSFNFNPKPNPNANPAIGPENPPGFDPNAVPLNLTGVPAATWIDLAVKNIAVRWTGPDIDATTTPNTVHNATVPAIITRPPTGAGSIRAKYLMFAQSVPKAVAHFELGVFRNPPPAPGAPAPSVRAFMSSSPGLGILDQNDNLATNFFTAAHETGHGYSLNDEYIEQVHDPPNPPGGPTYTGQWVLSWDSNLPGGPYQQDEVNAAVPGQAGMMNGNDQVRGRYFWHLAEWMRVHLTGTFDVDHDGRIYTVPPITQSTIGLKTATADRFTLVTWPLRQTYNVSKAPHCRHDVFLWPLGHDAYADVRLPGAVKSATSPPPATVTGYDGIMIAVVRLRLVFPATVTAIQMNTFLQGVDNAIARAYCFKFKANGTAGATTFNRVLMHFSPRFNARRFSPNPQTTGITQHITVNVGPTGTNAWTAATTFSMTQNAAGTTALVTAFGDMIGLTGVNTAVGSYTTLAGEVLGAAAVTLASV